MNKNYKPTIGLEIHAELKTKTKMFCDSINDSEEKRPNVNICPVCMAHPGVLPVINKEAIKHVLKMGSALGGTIADFTEFDRKNYFYPDIPKGYQISQYKFPLVSGGTLNGVLITRIHLEEDTARSSHDNTDYSLVDFNRAGIPLMELVTEPVIKNAKQASEFARELQLLLRTLGASDANMEKGEMRVEANISVSNTENFGTKVEVKNLNSFRTVERAIDYEIERQSKILARGEKVIQETRGWDESKQKTFSQRLKEESHDYRYFPDPDLPKLKISEINEFQESNIKRELPELPWIKRERLVSVYGVKPTNASMFVHNKELGDFFEKVAGEITDPKGIALAENYITSDVVGLITYKKTAKRPDLKGPQCRTLGFITVENFCQIITMLLENKISSRGAKNILNEMFQSEGGDPQEIAVTNGLLQKNSEGDLNEIINAIILENNTVVNEYKNGKEAALQFLVGQGMRASKGSANPALLKKLLIRSIKQQGTL